MIIYDKMIIQLFPSRLIIKQVTLDFEKVLWVEFRTVLSAVSFQSYIFHWMEAVWRKELMVICLPVSKF